MMWGGISLEARTELVPIVRGNLTTARYTTDILEPHFVPYGPFVGDNFDFMQDNARPHTALIIRQYLTEVGIPTLDWPARSPDLNPIEHVWDNLSRRVRYRKNAPTTINQLENALIEEWNNLPENFLLSLILSMPRRCQT